MTDKYSTEENIRWQHSLPTKRIAASVMFWNDKQELLIVKPNYRDYWNLPGGVVEEAESPLMGALREAEEEVGITIPATQLRLVSVDYRAPYDGFKDVVFFCFNGGILTHEQIKSIQLQREELDDYRFVPAAEAESLLSDWKGAYVQHYLLDPSDTVYLEDEKLIGKGL